MSCNCKVDPRQVLSHLNQLGYQNINGEQLKEFIKDLKKLIKYEQRKNEPKDADIENIPPALPYNILSPTANNSARPKQKVVSVQMRNSSHGNYVKQSKISDKIKDVSVQIKKSSHGNYVKQSKISDKSKESSYSSTTSTESKAWTIRDRQVQDTQSRTTSDTTKTDISEIVLTKNTKPSKHGCSQPHVPLTRLCEPVYQKIKPRSKSSGKHQNTEPSKHAKFQSNSWCLQAHLPLTRHCEPERQKIKPGSRSSGIPQSKAYIVPKGPLKNRKTDPVALYHAYKKFWKTQSFPGENSHFELRCAIRERTLSQHRKQIMSASPSMESVARQRRSSSSIR